MVKLIEDREAECFRYQDNDWRITAYEAPSGRGITCQVFTRHYPYTTVVFREINDIPEAERIASEYINGRA